MSTPKRVKKAPSAVQAIGPLKAIGLLLGTITPMVSAIHRTATGIESAVDGTFNQVDNAFEALDLVVDNAMLDFANDNIVADAKRLVARKTAEAEAKVIIDGLTVASK
jgi:prophage DNA circulation protein